MSRKAPPEYVISIMKRLEKRGFETYMVGGCVRDLIMGRRPCDWDLCTSALPAEVMAVFPHSRPTGLRHGTVTVVSHGSAAEVTTFRSDGEYKDHRRPESVRFTGDIVSDLMRRDFTVNALALSLAGDVTDPFGGRADIAKRLIRCVGDPEKRFEEDALRMLRAFRFSAVPGFDIEEKTLAAIRQKAALSESLARERVRQELEKILLSDSPEVISSVIAYGLLRGLVRERAAAPELAALAKLPKKRGPRWSGLCSLLLKSGHISDAGTFLSALRTDSATLRSVSKGCALVSEKAPENAAEWKKLLSAHGTEAAFCAAAGADVLYGSGHMKLLRSVLRSGECFSLRQLAVSGGDLALLGYKGPELGRKLFSLLEHVIEQPSDNDRRTLLSLAEKREPRL